MGVGLFGDVWGVHVGMEDHAMGWVHSRGIEAQGTPPVEMESTQRVGPALTSSLRLA